MNAADIKVTEWNRGDRFRIVDVNDKYAGRSGTLELAGGKTYLLVDGTYHAVRLENLVKVNLRIVE